MLKISIIELYFAKFKFSFCTDPFWSVQHQNKFSNFRQSRGFAFQEINSLSFALG